MATSYRAITNLSASGVADLAAENNSATGDLVGNSDIVNETQDIGTVSEIITLGEILAGSAEYVELVNLDTTNFVSFSFENPAVAGTKTFKLKAGQSMLLATPSAALYAIADTATVKILKKSVEA
jgi:hypothetical protein